MAVPELRPHSADLGSMLADLCADRYTIAGCTIAGCTIAGYTIAGYTIADYPAAYVDLEGVGYLDCNCQPDFGATETLVVAIVVGLVCLNPPVWGTEPHFGPRREDN